MLHNGGNTEGLFRGAFMESGFPYPIGPIEQGQPIYDSVVQRVGCSSANDTLDCLRTVPYEELVASFNTFPSIFSYQVCVSPCRVMAPITDALKVNSTIVWTPHRWSLPGRQSATTSLETASSPNPIRDRFVLIFLPADLVQHLL